jgi:hypothetical protein
MIVAHLLSRMVLEREGKKSFNFRRVTSSRVSESSLLSIGQGSNCLVTEIAVAFA